MTPLPCLMPFGYTETTMSPALSKTLLTILGGALASAATVLPPPWATVALVLGGFLGGGALVRRPGDEKVEPVDAPPRVKL
jgi:hypothetical protein